MTDDLEPMAVGPGAEPLPDGVVDALDAQATSVEAAADRQGAADQTAAPRDDGDVELLRLIDRLAALLDRSDLTELEVESGGTGLVLRKPSALAPDHRRERRRRRRPRRRSRCRARPTRRPGTASRSRLPSPRSRRRSLASSMRRRRLARRHTWRSAARSRSGQIIGLIEAMKLFNEIKSDLAGRVVRVVAESGALVKAKQPLIEVEPL